MNNKVAVYRGAGRAAPHTSNGIHSSHSTSKNAAAIPQPIRLKPAIPASSNSSRGVSGTTAPPPCVPGAKQAAFLRLVELVREETSNLQLHAATEELRQRCDALINSNIEISAQPSFKQNNSINVTSPPIVELQPLQLDGSVERAILSPSMNTLYADVQKLEQQRIETLQLRPATQSHDLPSATVQTNATIMDQSHSSPTPPAHYAPPLESNAAAQIEEKSEQILPSHSSVAPESSPAFSRPIATPFVPTAAAQESTVVADALSEFPVLQRVAALRAMSTATTTPAADPFPALARALQLRRQRLENLQAESALAGGSASTPISQPSATMVPAHFTPRSAVSSTPRSATVISAPVPSSPSAAVRPARPPESDEQSMAKQVGVNGTGTSPLLSLPSSPQRSSLPAAQLSIPQQPGTSTTSVSSTSEEVEVQNLLRQQALLLICDQVQTRVKQLTVCPHIPLITSHLTESSALFLVLLS
jgi:hypothetical protein